MDKDAHHPATPVTPRCSRLQCMLVGLFMLSAHASVAPAAEPTAQAADTVEEVVPENPEDPDVMDEVIVYGTSGQLIAGMRAEAELDAEGIAGYGANTVGELIAQVAPNVDNSEEGPVILINGKPANGIRSVNDLPPEAIKKLQVLPPQAAGAVGENPNRRVLNIVLQPEFRQGAGNLTVRGATAGQGFGANSNVGMLKLKGNVIRQFSVNASTTDPLFEAHRGIVSQPTTQPYDLTGNVVAWPLTGAEIDPDLSALAGTPATVLGVPVGVVNPALADFVPLANIANTSDMGRYRTLVSDQTNIGFNSNWGQPLPRKSTLQLNMNVDRSKSHSFTGATSTLLHVPASSPFSPFSNDVNIARYLGEPLRQDRESTNMNISANVGAQLGRWRLILDTGFAWNSSTTDSERRVDTAPLQAAVLAGDVNPFDVLPSDLLTDVLSDHARSRGHNGMAQLQLSGSIFDLPAGKANTNLRVEWRESRQRSRTTGTNNVESDRKRRDEAAYLSVQLPLLGTPNPQGFGLGGELSGSTRQVTATRALYNYGYGLNWRMGNRITLRVGINREQVAPQPNSLTDPVIIIDDYRAYDFIRQETVLVRYITGGNPDLGVENRDVTRVSGTVRPFKKVEFTLNAEYQRAVGHDVLSSLPPVSEDVQAAFPDRYRRDADGRLYEIDARLVSFERTQTESLRWGGSFTRSFGVPVPARPPAQGQMIILSDGDALSGTGWRMTANFTHTWQLSNTRLARAGLPVVDMLAGGTGNGSGQSRHNVQSRVGLAYSGTGLTLNTNWKSRTHIIAGTTSAPNDIVFSPLLRFDLQAFANLGSVYPARKPLQGIRISLNVDNLLDAKQRVRDQNGATPLRYQPYLINSLGRVVSLSFRKTF
jgi:hypothetical protein